jgi:hypothetical protein
MRPRELALIAGSAVRAVLPPAGGN